MRSRSHRRFRAGTGMVLAIPAALALTACEHDLLEPQSPPDPSAPIVIQDGEEQSGTEPSGGE